MKTEVAVFSTVAILLLSLSALIGAFCWPYALNTWLVFLGKTAVVTWWQGALIGFIPIVGRYSLVAAFVTWILMLFIS
jgi:hypothetical protein